MALTLPHAKHGMVNGCKSLVSASGMAKLARGLTVRVWWTI
jgi:hypothetical protein